ncbi:MAG: type II secretion system F family protein [Bacillota bacterium]|jgi:type II secretory pathway component PulF
MQFAYKVSDARGRMETGRAEAESREQLIARFKSQGKFPLEVKAEGKGKGAAATVKAPGGGIKAQERLIFTQQLGGLLSSGISIERALEIMSRLANNVRITELVRQLKRSLQEGHSFTNALEMFPKHFPTLYISMVRAGEAGGILAQVLKKLAQYQEEEIALRRFVVSSLTYPAMIMVASSLAVVYFVGDVIPKFQGILEGMGQELPLITKLVMAVGTAFKDYWWALLLLIGLMFLWLIRHVATTAGRVRLDRLKLQLPLLGDLMQKVAVSKMAMALSLLTNSGVPLLAGLNITSEIVGNAVLGKALREVEREVRGGNTLVSSMHAQKVFPVMAVEMIGVGEESGNINEMLEQVAKTYDGEVKNALGIFMSLFEPLLILAMVGVIGILAVAVLLPLVNLNSQL